MGDKIMANIRNMNEEEVSDLKAFVEERQQNGSEMEAEFFQQKSKLEEHFDYLNQGAKNLVEHRLETIEQKVISLSKEVGELKSIMQRVFGDHALIDGQWISVNLPYGGEIDD
jgi:uncharacterized protein YicC (UPF0701 family)